MTGGKSTRFGSDKSAIVLGGISLIEKILKNLPDGNVIIVGPKISQSIREVTFTQEEPTGGGPVAAVAAALPLIHTPEVCILATDMPFSAQVVSALLNQPFNNDALIPTDVSGRIQPLCARYKRVALESVISRLGDPDGKSMRAVIAELDVTEFKNDLSLIHKIVDIDTPEDLARIKINFSKELETE